MSTELLVGIAIFAVILLLSIACAAIYALRRGRQEEAMVDLTALDFPRLPNGRPWF